MNDSKIPSWLPYVAPMFAFLLLVEIGGRVDPRYALAMLVLKAIVPLGLIVFFRAKGAYPELRFSVSGKTLLDIGVGVALAAVWIVPYIIFPTLRPADDVAFDPGQAGASLVGVMIVLRLIGYAAVTPVMEELFMRSFLMRYADVFDSDDDFREVPIGRYRLRSFLVVVAVFLATHAMWEWWVMLPWAVLTNLWFYWRKDLFAIIVVHAATNAAILIAAVALGGKIFDAGGAPLSLWFFL